jgi:hypothetical protein
MKTTIEHLVTLRFEVIADYPKSKFEVGSILSRVKNATNDWYDLGDSNPDLGIIQKQELIQYPHLFRPLNWWENRSEEEMPMFINYSSINKYYKVDQWIFPDKNEGFGTFAVVGSTKILIDHPIYPDHNILPCSEEDYLANQ